jgi:hypothetical protein
MPLENIRVPSFDGRTFEASELIPRDITEETLQMDNLSPGRTPQVAEPISDRPDQLTLMELCEEYSRSDTLPGRRIMIEEVLSANGFDLPESKS